MADEGYSSFRWYDYVLFGSTLVVALGIGVYYAITGRKQGTVDEFLMGSRTMGAIAGAMTMFASVTAGQRIIGAPAELYEHGITNWNAIFGHIIGGCIAAWLFIPLIYGMGYSSVHTYLLRRYNSKILYYWGSCSTVLSYTLSIGASIYSPAIALEAVAGVPVTICSATVGFVVVVYCTMGGFKAVVGTDIFQGVVILIGSLLVMILGTIKVGGVSELWDTAKEGGRLDIRWTPSPFVRMSFFTALFSTGIGSMITPFSQQMSQRIVASASKRKATRAFIGRLPLMTAVNSMTYACGIVVYVYYAKLGCDPLKTGQITSPNQLLAFFVMDGLRIPGLPGLFTVVIFAAALSTISTLLNAAVTITSKMMENRLSFLSARNKLIANKILVTVYGSLGVGATFLYINGRGNILQMSNTLAASVSGPIIGVFILGMVCPWSEWRGALVGLICGFGLSLALSVGSTYYFPWGQTLNTTTENCYQLGHNVTKFGNGEINYVNAFYMISYEYYKIIAWFTAAFIGAICMIFVRQSASDCDPRLQLPLFEKVGCCLPARWREWLHFGVDYSTIKVDQRGRYDMTGLEEDDEKKLGEENPVSKRQDKETENIGKQITTRF